MEAYQYKLLIGGIGDDAHSVGIGLLELGFREAGFFVTSIGIRNTIESFFRLASDYDIILLSNKNGHAELYLDTFSRLMSEFLLTDDSPKLWYLGGSLSVSEPDHAVKRRFRNMGFTGVYPKPVAFQDVLEDIRRDVHRFDIRKKYVLSGINRPFSQAPPMNYDGLTERKWTREELFTERKEVLKEWPTGSRVNMTMPCPSSSRSLDDLLWCSELAGRPPLLQPRTGVADISAQLELLKYLEIAGSDISSVQLDAASRSRDYRTATIGRDKSLERAHSVLNGFPIPVYGVDNVRGLVHSLKTPFQLRGGGPDHRFTYEIALSGGVSAVEGGFICYLMPYDKVCSPVASLHNWQYIDRLCAYYEEEHAISINREYFGVLTASLIEPSLAIVVNIVQSILSAQQGCKSITLGYAEQGNRSQDIAAMQVMKEMSNYYLNKFHFTGCRLTTVFHQYMAAFPSEYAKAEDLIFNSAITATLAGATKMMVKTSVEAINIPDKVENAKALSVCKRASLMAAHVSPAYETVRREKAIIRKEVRQIMNAIIDLGNNSIALGALKAIEYGIIDIPWSPNNYNGNKVMGIRDVNGAIRFLDTGGLPFSEEIKEFHFERVQERKMAERSGDLFSLLEQDLSRIWRNDFKCWPLDGHYIV